MKKSFLILLFTTGSLLWATSDGPDYWKVMNVAADDLLNLRAKAHWSSKKVGTIPPDGQETSCYK